jgi:hypothetical protein
VLACISKMPASGKLSLQTVHPADPLILIQLE